jgi:uncharacterized protein
MRRLAVAALTLGLAVAAFAQREPAIPPPQGFVTDRAGVIPADAVARMTQLLGELRAKTGAEIAVLTVDTTAPLDDFTYAMRVAEAWKPGRKGADTGLVFVVVVKDRKLRVVTGYGLEGILPDGLVGAIEDEEVVPSLRAGKVGEGVERGVRAFASRIAAGKGVTLSGVPPPRRLPAPEPNAVPIPGWLAFLILLLVIGFLVYVASHPRAFGSRGWQGGFFPGGYGGGGFGGGFGGGGGGFGGFGGGSFGGGGAGRSW